MIWLVSLLLVTHLFADNTALYRVSVPVTSQNQNVVRTQLPVGLQQVLIRLSGHANPEHIVSQKIDLKTAQKSITRYYFESDDCPDTTEICQTLHMEFSSSAIQQLLRESGRSVWTRKRPPSLAEIYFVNDGQETLITQQSNVGYQ